eukprot:1492750-Rhodomonas_salina.1
MMVTVQMMLHAELKTMRCIRDGSIGSVLSIACILHLALSLTASLWVPAVTIRRGSENENLSPPPRTCPPLSLDRDPPPHHTHTSLTRRRINAIQAHSLYKLYQQHRVSHLILAYLVLSVQD